MVATLAELPLSDLCNSVNSSRRDPHRKHLSDRIMSRTTSKRSAALIVVSTILAALQLRSSSAFVHQDASRVHSSMTNKRPLSRRPRRHSTLLPSSKIESATTSPSNDEIAVREQLGYLPTNFVKVTARTAIGKKPVAIQTYPLNGGAARRKTKAKGELTPFPTLYWLCSPDICRAVADLERRGYVGVLEERLKSEEQYVERYVKAHVTYAEERWESLTAEDRSMLEDVASGTGNDENSSITEGMVNMIRSSGIAGRARPFEPCIKCLHSHYAHYRSGGILNIVGKWTDEILREEFADLDL